MRRGMTMLAATVALLLAFGLAACGNSSDSSSSTTNESPSQQAAGKSNRNPANGAAEDKAGGNQAQSGGSAADFTPKHHSDSGGGSAQFKVKGGDNSVQEFGEEAGSSEFEAAAAVVHDFLDARAEGNWAVACTYMSKATITSIEHLARGAKPGTDTSCGAILAGVISPAAQPQIKAEAEKADVRSLRTEGEQAFVIYTGAEGTVLAMPMANEDGEWKVTSLTGSPLN